MIRGGILNNDALNLVASNRNNNTSTNRNHLDARCACAKTVDLLTPRAARHASRVTRHARTSGAGVITGSDGSVDCGAGAGDACRQMEFGGDHIG
jgi:hypothetical protein